MTDNEVYYCSFCGLSSKEVKKLVSGENVFICDSCVQKCVDVINDKTAKAYSKNDDSSNTTSKIASKPKTPREIKDFLDQYIIGQDFAKEVISVGVYNHLKRLANPIIDGVELEKSNILLCGPTGVGKCCSKNTQIKIRIFLMLELLDKPKTTQLTTTFGDLFQMISETENVEHVLNQEYFQKTKIQIQNEHGEWCSVIGLITKKDKLRILKWSDGSTTECADKHWIRVYGEHCKLACDFEYGDEILRADGITLLCLENTLYDDDHTFYDLQIDTPSHLYQTADRIVHHNTLIAQTIARMLDVPFTIADATSLTEAGYVGEDVESILGRLLAAANNDIKKAEHGIVFVDEIDKKRSGGGGSNSRDVSGEGVQQALLKLLEGSEVMVAPSGMKKNSNTEMVKINTKNILFIVGGAFVGLEKMIEQAKNKSAGVGFSASVKNKNIENILSHIEPEHLMQFGLIPELIGRLPIIAPLSDLDQDQLVKVLTEPKNAIVKQMVALFRLEGIELEFKSDALQAIAKIAKDRKTNGRALRSVLENRLMKTQFNLPDFRNDGVKKIIVDIASINDGSQPICYKEDEIAHNGEAALLI